MSAINKRLKTPKARQFAADIKMAELMDNDGLVIPYARALSALRVVWASRRGYQEAAGRQVLAGGPVDASVARLEAETDGYSRRPAAGDVFRSPNSDEEFQFALTLVEKVERFGGFDLPGFPRIKASVVGQIWIAEGDLEGVSSRLLVTPEGLSARGWHRVENGDSNA